MRLIILSLLVITCSQVYALEYRGQKDRYDENLLRNDPEVLVSTTKKQEITVIAQDKVVDPPIKVSSCVEWDGECKPSEYFKSTVSE